MFKIKGKRLGESSLYSGTAGYLALMYKRLYGNETVESMSKSQFAVILPIFLEKDGQFVKDILRPLFMEAGWISESDFKSKLVFFGELEAKLYAEQLRRVENPTHPKPQKIAREKRNMCCLVQRDLYSNSLMLTLDIIQMRYDKDFIAASKSPPSSSSRAQILTPQFMVPSKTIFIQNWVSAKTLLLPRYLLSRIFPGSSNIITFAHGDLNGFYWDNEYQNVDHLKELISMLLISYDHNVTMNLQTT